VRGTKISGLSPTVLGLATGEKLLIAIFEVLGKLIDDLGFARRIKFQRGKSAENFGFPFRHFQPP
jgi:hypothetical protein